MYFIETLGIFVSPKLKDQIRLGGEGFQINNISVPVNIFFSYLPLNQVVTIMAG